MIRNFVDYLIPTIISRGLGFFLIPYMITKMIASDYGQLGLILLVVYFIFDLLHHSSSGYFSLYFFKKKDEKKANLIWELISEQIFSLTFLLLLFTVFYFLLSDSIWISGQILFTAFLIISSRSLNFLFLSHFKVNQMSRKYGIVELLEAISVAAFTIYLFETHEGSIENRLLALALGSILSLIISIIFFRNSFKHFVFSFDLKKYKEIFIFGFKLYPHVFGGLLLLASDRLFLTYYQSLTDVGLYTVAFQYASVLLILNTLSTRIFQPLAYEYFNSSDLSKFSRKYLTPYASKYLTIILLITFFLLVSIFLFSGWIFPGEYSEGLLPSLILSLAFMIYWLATFPVPFLVNSNKNQILSYSTVIATFLNLIANQILVPNYSTLGASLATLFAISSAMLFTYFFAWKIDKNEIKTL